ncbi:MAG: efflux RND transporter periplasmic adaptor subunit [Pseudomonadota bacterium]|nr:efflux RND transporter periplasmic adaptor subunit [Pseudomonadota bacterium]
MLPKTLHLHPHLLTGATVAIALAGLFLMSGCSQPADAQAAPPQAPPVSVAPAVQRQVSDSEEFSGRLEAAEYVELRPRVSGTIEKVHFADGALVRKGDLLFSIDARPFEAEAARAQSQLTSMKARSELAQSEFARAQKLLESQAVSKQEVDQLGASQRTSRADIQGAEAALRIARLNIEYAQVRAPISGRISRANVTAGNVVNEQSVLTSIAGVSKVYAYFDGSERTFLRLQDARASGGAPKVRMALLDEPDFAHEGQVDFIDNRLNPQTGAIRMRVSFDNASGRFTPGLSARLRMQSATAHDAVLVPERAIGTDQTKKFVYVVEADGKPQFREVHLGALADGMRIVQGGVKGGEHVVVEGLQRIQPGMTVTPQLLPVDAKGMPVFAPPAGAPGAAAAADKKTVAKT